MIADFYNYIVEEDENNVITYGFSTKSGALYYVYFDPNQYVEHIDKYPALLNAGFGFGFFRYGAQNHAKSDLKIANTISRIIIDFMNETSHDSVLLFHCDYGDNRQGSRDKLFETWYNNCDAKNEIIKKRIEVNRINDDGSITEFFLGCLISVKNKKANEVETQFDLFSENLTNTSDK